MKPKGSWYSKRSPKRVWQTVVRNKWSCVVSGRSTILFSLVMLTLVKLSSDVIHCHTSFEQGRHLLALCRLWDLRQGATHATDSSQVTSTVFEPLAGALTWKSRATACAFFPLQMLLGHFEKELKRLWRLPDFRIHVKWAVVCFCSACTFTFEVERLLERSVHILKSTLTQKLGLIESVGTLWSSLAKRESPHNLFLFNHSADCYQGITWPQC